MERIQAIANLPRNQDAYEEDQYYEFSSDDKKLIRRFPQQRQVIRRDFNQEREGYQQDYKMKIDLPIFGARVILRHFLIGLKTSKDLLIIWTHQNIEKSN